MLFVLRCYLTMSLIRKAFKRVQYPVDIIVQCVRWYRAYALSLRNLEEMMVYGRTDIKIKGQWKYLYRAVDTAGHTIDFLLTARGNTAAALRFFARPFVSMANRRS